MPGRRDFNGHTCPLDESVCAQWIAQRKKFLQAQIKSGNLPFALVFNNQPNSEPWQRWLAVYGVAAPSNEYAAAAQNRGLHINIEIFD